MGHQLFKSCVITLMCVVFVYAGVLSVFDPCPDHQQRLSRAPSEAQHEAGPSFSSETSDDSLPTLECAPVGHSFLFAAGTFYAAMVMAPFKRTLTLSHHSDLFYRLFLSILQILLIQYPFKGRFPDPFRVCLCLRFSPPQYTAIG